MASYRGCDAEKKECELYSGKDCGDCAQFTDVSCCYPVFQIWCKQLIFSVTIAPQTRAAMLMNLTTWPPGSKTALGAMQDGSSVGVSLQGCYREVRILRGYVNQF